MIRLFTESTVLEMLSLSQQFSTEHRITFSISEKLGNEAPEDKKLRVSLYSTEEVDLISVISASHW